MNEHTSQLWLWGTIAMSAWWFHWRRARRAAQTQATRSLAATPDGQLRICGIVDESHSTLTAGHWWHVEGRGLRAAVDDSAPWVVTSINIRHGMPENEHSQCMSECDERGYITSIKMRVGLYGPWPKGSYLVNVDFTVLNVESREIRVLSVPVTVTTPEPLAQTSDCAVKIFAVEQDTSSSSQWQLIAHNLVKLDDPSSSPSTWSVSSVAARLEIAGVEQMGHFGLRRERATGRIGTIRLVRPTSWPAGTYPMVIDFTLGKLATQNTEVLSVQTTVVIR